MACFRGLGHEVDLICGGDLASGLSTSAAVGRRSDASLRGRVSGSIPDCLVHSLSEFRDLTHDRRLYALLKRRIARHRPDLIWERSSRLHWAGLRMAGESGIPSVIEYMDSLTRYRWSLFKQRAIRLEEKKIRLTDRILVTSSVLARRLAAEYGVSQEKFLVAINAVDADEFHQPAERTRMRDRYGLGPEDFVVGYTGSFAWYHGMDLLRPTAEKLVSQRLPRKVVFCLVGDGPGLAPLETAVSTPLLKDHFLFPGRVDSRRVPAYLSMFDAAVLPDCLDIICPIKVQEYMAAALPVVVPNYEANREVVTDGDTGLLFTPKNHADLAGCLLKLIENHPALGRSIGDRAHSLVRTRLNWEATWGKALDASLNILP